jgi:hypothetical protein
VAGYKDPIQAYFYHGSVATFRDCGACW